MNIEWSACCRLRCDAPSRAHPVEQISTAELGSADRTSTHLTESHVDAADVHPSPASDPQICMSDGAVQPRPCCPPRQAEAPTTLRPTQRQHSLQPAHPRQLFQPTADRQAKQQNADAHGSEQHPSGQTHSSKCHGEHSVTSSSGCEGMTSPPSTPAKVPTRTLVSPTGSCPWPTLTDTTEEAAAAADGRKYLPVLPMEGRPGVPTCTTSA